MDGKIEQWFNSNAVSYTFMVHFSDTNYYISNAAEVINGISGRSVTKSTTGISISYSVRDWINTSYIAIGY